MWTDPNYPEDLRLLLQAWRSRNLDRFRTKLRNVKDIDFVFEGKEEGDRSILGIIAHEADPKDNDCVEFVEALIDRGVDTERQFRKDGDRAIHIVSKNANLTLLKVLLTKGSANVNAVNGICWTALHCIIIKWDEANCNEYKKCMEYLLDHPKINVNIVSKAGCVPIHLAAREGRLDAVMLLLKKGKKLFIDHTVDHKYRTPRKDILKKYPELKERLPPERQELSLDEIDFSMLFFYLGNGEEERFCKVFEQKLHHEAKEYLLTVTNGEGTLLEAAVDAELIKAIKLLLSHGADVNVDGFSKNMILSTVKKGNVEILEILLGSNPKLPKNSYKQTVFHILVLESENIPVVRFESCLKLLIKKWKNSMNDQDYFGNTALHYAAFNSPFQTVPVLLKEGFYIGVKNYIGLTPLRWLPPKLIQQFLDTKITESEGKIVLRSDKDYHYILDFEFLKPTYQMNSPISQCGRKQHETAPLLEMTRIPELKNLLNHPVITSFTFLKWHRIRYLFLLNLISYTIFCALLATYVMFGYPKENNTNCAKSTNRTNCTNVVNANYDTENPPSMIELRAFILFFDFLFFIREFFQLAVNPKMYLTNIENFLELLIIILTAIVCINDCSQSSTDSACHQLCSITILLSWVGLLLLIGKHPLFAIQIEMLKTVTQSYVKFLGLYIILIIGFSFSFFIIFSGQNQSLFRNPLSSFFKTIVMVSGEIGLDDIEFPERLDISYFIFVSFIIILLFVLLNLLNGIAVADTKVLRDEARLRMCVSVIRLLDFIEEILEDRHSSLLLKSFPRIQVLLGKFSNYFAIFSKKEVRPTPIKIYPNVYHKSKNCRLIPLNLRGQRELRDFKSAQNLLDVDIIDAARAMIEERHNTKNIGQSEAKSISDCYNRIDDLKVEIKTISDSLNLILKEINRLGINKEEDVAQESGL